MKHVLLVSLLLGSLGCQTLFEREVGLNRFEATDGSYFPYFILKVFRGSQYFTKIYPELAAAKSGIKVIEVRRLNEKASDSVNEVNLSWSADGVYLSYETIDSNVRRIELKNILGDYSRKLLVIPKKRNNFLRGLVHHSIHSYNAGLSWSRDSTKFAFMSNGGVGEYNIYVGAVGVVEKPVARSPSKDGYASWNPVENKLVFVSARSGNGDLYLLDLNSKKLLKLTSSSKVDFFPHWFPDGQKLVYSSGDASNHDIYLTEKRDQVWRRPIRLTTWRQDDLRPTVSPDGKLIAFYASSWKNRKSKPTWNIHVVPYEYGRSYSSSELRRRVVARDVVVDLNTGPAWTPDSRKIFYVKNDSKNFNPIFGYDLSTGRSYHLETNTRMNRDILMSNLGVLSFRAQVGAWDKVFIALTNQGLQLQKPTDKKYEVRYEKI